MGRPEVLWVLYDDTCGFCCRCADFLRAQEKVLPLTCLPRSGPVAQRWFGPLCVDREELVVVDSAGGVYRGGDAFVMALWALTLFRPWAQRAGREPLRSRARALFHWVSSHRADLSEHLRLRPERKILEVLDACADDEAAARCDTGACALPQP